MTYPAMCSVSWILQIFSTIVLPYDFYSFTFGHKAYPKFTAFSVNGTPLTECFYDFVT